ncbi:ImmA/IrrE family metallo-endopeptidase [Parvibaculum sedimenti]|uniref:ImmA/IrrE family metallo-endopeptidase n=1 Tax=Parvibaculum sedimenti TaxID=2608632 RepID=A0A6N6VJJ5_9HYPH|nr:XRE family transcriptional regulator [Parvibaculum sedimenti]KAB7738663.1 ImmA/IrrE family metallo-endopeptidase [Parvibaculum sedimenti]
MASEKKVFAGPRVRRLRRERNLTQARMAADLGISASYLNLIERNQRPMSAQILLKLAEVYDVELKSLAGDDEARALTALREVFGDPLFRDSGLTTQDMQEVASASPAAAEALATLYRAYQQAVANTSLLAERLADRDLLDGGQAVNAPLEEVRDFINSRNNHFPVLDETAEELYRKASLGADEPYVALRNYLRVAHGVATRVVPADLMSGELRRYDRHRQTIFLSELIDQPGRSFQLAYQLAYFEQSRAIEDIVETAGLKDDEARTLCRVALANYFAAALLMPYAAFLRTAEESRYDLRLVGRRFGTSFEQVCHRLTTLQRPGARGIPFFLIRVDNAGNVSKRFSAAGFHFARFGGTCPRWNVHDAFRVPGQIYTQVIQMEDGTRYFSIARTVSRAGSGIGVPGDQYVVGLGCEITHARKLVYSQGYDLNDERGAMPIGVNCRLCERLDCSQRAFPPLKQKLRVEDHVRGISPFGVPVSNG